MPVPPDVRRAAGAELLPGAIGYSSQRRPILVSFAGHPRADLRLLILGGQHGDERRASGAVERFTKMGQQIAVGSDVRLAMIPRSNPDGAAHRTRRNANGVDLNRDHQLLQADETQALHRFVRSWRPHLIVDVHTYPARRKHLLARGLVYCHDVFLDLPTNPSVRLPVTDQQMRDGVASITSALCDRGFRAARYLLVRRGGRIRHSTPDAVDARNQFALRYGIPTLLLEGRQRSRKAPTSQVSGHMARAMTSAFELIVDWAASNRAALLQLSSLPQPGEQVAIGCRYVQASQPASFAFADADSGVVKEILLEGIFTPDVVVTQSVRLPSAYLVPMGHQAVLATLARHSFDPCEVPDHCQTRTMGYRITHAANGSRPNRAARDVRYKFHPVTPSRSDFVAFSVQQPGGHALAALLEPASKYGLARIAEMQLPVDADCDYPVLRCE